MARKRPPAWQPLWEAFARLNRRQQLVVIGVVVLLGILLLLYRAHQSAQQAQPSQPSAPLAVTPGGLPDMPVKPAPLLVVFNGCPPEGDNPHELEQNRLKNRSDEGNYVPVEFDAVARLSWPKHIERRDRDNWTAEDRAAIGRYEGIPISIEGYLAGAKRSGPESCNCHGAEADMNDYHVWLVKETGDDRDKSIVVEPTPRTLAKHPAWTVAALTELARSRQRVRISGWLFMDPEHPDQVGKTRGTIWEIHPVMRIEVQRGNGWAALDDLR